MSGRAIFVLNNVDKDGLARIGAGQKGRGLFPRHRSVNERVSGVQKGQYSLCANKGMMCHRDKKRSRFGVDD